MLPSLEAGLSAPLGSACGRRGQIGAGWHSSGPAWTNASGSPNLPADVEGERTVKHECITAMSSNIKSAGLHIMAVPVSSHLIDN